MIKGKLLIVLVISLLAFNFFKPAVVALTATPAPTACPTPVTGDANGDCRVDQADFQIWLSHYALISSLVSEGNFNSPFDTKINTIDFGIWRKNYQLLLPSPSPTRSPSPTPSFRPSPFVSPLPTPHPSLLPSPPAAGIGIWTSVSELAAKPMSGAAWNNLKSAADTSWGSADLSNQDSQHPQYVLAGALVYTRTGQTLYKDKVISGLRSIIGTEAGARSLALGRNLAAYAVSADLVGYQDASFKSFLSSIRTRVNSEGRTIITCHEDRPNNWGTMCGASRIAIDLYIGDRIDLDRAAKIFHGYVGDRSAYASFIFQSVSLSWMCDSSQPRPENPLGCVKDGHDLSGAPVDDVSRGGSYTWPPTPTNYAWGGFSAAVAQAEMLHRAGYPAYDWENQAIRRGMDFLERAMASSASSPTEWMPWVVNHHYGTNFAAVTPTGWGRLMAWTDYTHD